VSAPRAILYSIDRTRRVLFRPADIIQRPGVKMLPEIFVGQVYDDRFKNYKTVLREQNLGTVCAKLDLMPKRRT
jgi:hypothetical protein